MKFFCWSNSNRINSDLSLTFINILEFTFDCVILLETLNFYNDQTRLFNTKPNPVGSQAMALKFRSHEKIISTSYLLSLHNFISMKTSLRKKSIITSIRLCSLTNSFIPI